MKQFTSRLFLALCLVLLLVFSASAADASVLKQDYVADTAALLPDSEQTALLQLKAEEISEEYQCSVYLLTVSDYTYVTSGDILTYAQDLYQTYDLGWGENRDGILLVLSMADRDYALIAHGDFGNAAFTDYGKEQLSEAFLDNFREDDWYGGFEDSLQTSIEYLELARNGTPFDADSDPDRLAKIHMASVMMVIFVPLLVAGFVCLLLKRRMKSARKASTANAYVVEGGTTLRVCRDEFSHVTHRRVRIKQDSNGGTSVNGSGFSGRGGKF